MWLAHFRRHMRDRLIDFCKQKFGTRQEVLVANLDTPRASFGLLIAHEVLRDKGGLFLRSSIIGPFAAIAVRDQVVSCFEDKMVMGHFGVSPQHLDPSRPGKPTTAGPRKKFRFAFGHAELGNPIVALAAMRGIVHWNVWLRVFVGTVSDISWRPRWTRCFLQTTASWSSSSPQAPSRSHWRS